MYALRIRWRLLHPEQAFEDVCVLNDCLDDTGDDLAKALPLFTKR
jgi:hypothetical protein